MVSKSHYTLRGKDCYAGLAQNGPWKFSIWGQPYGVGDLFGLRVALAQVFPLRLLGAKLE